VTSALVAGKSQGTNFKGATRALRFICVAGSGQIYPDRVDHANVRQRALLT
jgi:hypothetical protein